MAQVPAQYDANYRAPQQNQKLPYPESFASRFGIDYTQWEVLTDAIFPSAKSAESIAMALSYCKARNLDPFKKVVNIVPMYSKAIKGYIDTVWPSIAELRTTAHRTGLYAGCDETVFGPEVTQEFVLYDKNGREESRKKVTFPKWAQVTVYRVCAGGVIGKFVGDRVNWLETFARVGRSEFPNEMWQKRAEGQLSKCAEAAALRKAFPEELGNVYSAEEMQGQVMFSPPARAEATTLQSAQDVHHAPAAEQSSEPRTAAPLQLVSSQEVEEPKFASITWAPDAEPTLVPDNELYQSVRTATEKLINNPNSNLQIAVDFRTRNGDELRAWCKRKGKQAREMIQDVLITQVDAEIARRATQQIDEQFDAAKTESIRELSEQTRAD